MIGLPAAVSEMLRVSVATRRARQRVRPRLCRVARGSEGSWAEEQGDVGRCRLLDHLLATRPKSGKGELAPDRVWSMYRSECGVVAVLGLGQGEAFIIRTLSVRGCALR